MKAIKKPSILATVKRPKTVTKARKSAAGDNDLKRLKALVRRLLRYLELYHKNPPKDGNKELENLFGQKTSYMDALTALSQLMLKLNQLQQPQPSAEKPETDCEDVPMSAADIGLVEAFVRRVRERENVIPA